MLLSLNLNSLLNAMPGSIAQGLIWGIMAFGVFVTFRLLDFADLTVDGSMMTGGATAVMLIKAGVSPWIALLAAFAAGMAAGFVTGILHTAFGIPGILASILTQLSLYSINYNILGKAANQAISVNNYKLLASLRYVNSSGSDRIIFFAGLTAGIVILIAVLYWFFGTEIGQAIRATGCNESMARAQGINTNFIKVLALMISNGLVGMSGALYAQCQGAADVNMGRGAIVIGLAAVIIGEVLFGKLCEKRKLMFAWTLLSVAFGAVLYYIVYAVRSLSAITLSESSSTFAAVFGSSAAVCSSSSKRSGFIKDAIKSVIACRCPPDKRPTFVVSLSSRPSPNCASFSRYFARSAFVTPHLKPRCRPRLAAIARFSSIDIVAAVPVIGS